MITQIKYDNNIIKYTQLEINNFRNGKVNIANNESDVVKFIDASIKRSSNAKLYFGKIGNDLANKIRKELNIDIENYNISLKNDAIRHILNHHAKKSEILRGQIPITLNDFLLIPFIIVNYDKVYLSGYTDKGKPSITFEKKINNNYFLINYVQDKSKSLEVQTMYKAKKNSATGSNAKSLD